MNGRSSSRKSILVRCASGRAVVAPRPLRSRTRSRSARVPGAPQGESSFRSHEQFRAGAFGRGCSGPPLPPVRSPVSTRSRPARAPPSPRPAARSPHGRAPDDRSRPAVRRGPRGRHRGGPRRHGTSRPHRRSVAAQSGCGPGCRRRVQAEWAGSADSYGLTTAVSSSGRRVLALSVLAHPSFRSAGYPPAIRRYRLSAQRPGCRCE